MGGVTIRKEGRILTFSESEANEAEHGGCHL
jgi:hypothetical protein